jgi:hypothetical protein
LKHLFRVLGAAILAAVACARGSTTDDGAGASSAVGTGASNGTGGGTTGTGAMGGTGCDPCDEDGDGVEDGEDECPGTPSGEPVNGVGCADSQLDPELEDTFPPYGLTWTETGDLGRAGGLTWEYTNIDRGDLFHIYWILCDDPSTTCGVSLDGPIDTSAEEWLFSAANSDPAGGRLVFNNTTNIDLDDGSSPSVNGRLTVTIVNENDAPLPFADLATLGVAGRDGEYGAEIPGTGYTITAIIEIEDDAAWTPYLDYFDAQPTPDPGPGNAVSFGGSFYDE